MFSETAFAVGAPSLFLKHHEATFAQKIDCRHYAAEHVIMIRVSCNNNAPDFRYVNQTSAYAKSHHWNMCKRKVGAQYNPTKYKTQLCRHFLNGQRCNRGSRCHFAHGYHELELNTLKERHDAGLLDANVYRNKPCMIHVATGSW